MDFILQLQQNYALHVMAIVQRVQQLNVCHALVQLT